jgi:hypothetical protein
MRVFFAVIQRIHNPQVDNNNSNNYNIYPGRIVMVEIKDMPLDQAQRINQDAPGNRCTVVYVGSSIDNPPTVHHIRRHDIDPDGGNVIFVDNMELVRNEAYLCIPGEDDDADTAGCGRVGKTIRHITGERPEETLPVTVEIEGPLFEEIVQETIVGPDTDRRIEFKRYR